MDHPGDHDHPAAVQEAGAHLPFLHITFLNPRFLHRLDQSTTGVVDDFTAAALHALGEVDRAADLARRALLGDLYAEEDLRQWLAALPEGEDDKTHPRAPAQVPALDEDPMRHLFATGPVLDLAAAVARLSVGDAKERKARLAAMTAAVARTARRAAVAADVLAASRRSSELAHRLRACVSGEVDPSRSLVRRSDEIGFRHLALPSLLDVLIRIRDWSKNNAAEVYASLAHPKRVPAATVEREIAADGTTTLRLAPGVADPHFDTLWCGNLALSLKRPSGIPTAILPALRGGRLVVGHHLDDARRETLAAALAADATASPHGWRGGLMERLHAHDLGPPAKAGAAAVVEAAGFAIRRFEVFDRRGTLIGGAGHPPVEVDPGELYRVRWRWVGHGPPVPLSGDMFLAIDSRIWRELVDRSFLRDRFIPIFVVPVHVSMCIRRGLPAAIRIGRRAEGRLSFTVSPPLPEGATLNVREEDEEIVVDVHVPSSASSLTGVATTISVTTGSRRVDIRLDLDVMPDLGRWVRGGNLGVVATHSALLSAPGNLQDVKVICFGYDEEGRDHENKGEYQLWDPVSRTPLVRTGPRPTWTHGHSPFCAGHALLPDGDLLVVGGHIAHDLYDGGPAAKSIHRLRRLPSPEGETDWRHMPQMEDDRWYPTAITLASGRVLILGGSSQFLANPWNGTNEDYELFDPSAERLVEAPFDCVARDSWDWEERSGRAHTSDDDPSMTLRMVGLYSHAHLLPSLTETAPEGFVYVLTEFFARVYEPTTNVILDDPFRTVAGFPITLRIDVGGYRTWHNQGTSVLLPIDVGPDGDVPSVVRILVIGGGEHGNADRDEPARRDAVVLAWVLGAFPTLIEESSFELDSNRFMGDAVLLPTGEILVLNGARVGYTNENRDPVLEPTLIRIDGSASGAAPRFSLKAPLEPRAPDETDRRYHSSAILLPDGAVFVGGSSGGWGDGHFAERFNVDVYEPWYFQCQDRPEIVDTSEEIGYGQDLIVHTTTNHIQPVVILIRFGSATHSLNTDQRMLRIQIRERRERTVVARIPGNRTLVPPGPYLIFVINDAGFPSRGRALRIR
jgi:hypothetical protein